MLSRYEEYLDFEPDEFGRFTAKQSTAWKLGALQRPIVNEWWMKFAEILIQKVPSINIRFPSYEYIPTIDIDSIFAYRHKGFLRNV